MPAPQKDLTSSVRPLMTSKASKWLALVLNEHFESSGGLESLQYKSLVQGHDFVIFSEDGLRIF